MAELIEEIKLHDIKNVFSEPQFSDGNLQSFAKEYNLTIAILDPLGRDDSASGYLENLKTNLNNISIIYE
jgi:ABC-type Zn uptake system ZnuABC Zn-binding protein ZnuA